MFKWSLLLAVSLIGCSTTLAKVIVRPLRHQMFLTSDLSPEPFVFASEGLTLRGWYFRAPVPRRGVIVFMHGLSDNRHDGNRAAHVFLPQGYDVIAYDSRGHGASDGTYSSYGVHEKHDLARALDTIGAEHVIVIGFSLGAGVALQAAVEDRRIAAIVSLGVFSDLRRVVADRAGAWVSPEAQRQALIVAESLAQFSVDDASPVAAAAELTIPVLVMHGARDTATPPVHSERVFAALRGPKNIFLVPGAGHDDLLSHDIVWATIDAWVKALPP